MDPYGVIPVAVLIAISGGIAFVVIRVRRRLKTRSESRGILKLRPGDEPKWRDFVQAVSDISAVVQESKDLVMVSTERADSEIRSQVDMKIQAAIARVFPADVGVEIESLGSKTLLSRGKSRIEVVFTITRVDRTETLNLSALKYIWNLKVSRDSDLYTVSRLVAYVALGFLFLVIRGVDDDLIKAFLYCVDCLTLVGLLLIGFITNRRSHQDFSSEQLDALQTALREVFSAELVVKVQAAPSS